MAMVNSFKNTSVRTRLYGGFGLVLVLLIAVVSVAIMNMRDVKQTNKEIAERDWAKASMVYELGAVVLDGEAAALELLVSEQPARIAELRSKLSATPAKAESLLKQMEVLTKAEDEQEIIKRLMSLQGVLNNSLASIDKTLAEGDRASAVTIMNTQTLRIRKAFAPKLDELNILVKQRVADANAASEASQEQRLTEIIVLMLIAIGVGGGFSVLITRQMLGLLGGEPQFAATVAREIANGDLTRDIPVSPGDTESLIFAMKQMQDELRTTIRQIQDAAEKVVADAGTMSSASVQVYEFSDKQSKAAATTATSAEAMTSRIGDVTGSADIARTMAVESGNLSVEGNSIVHVAIDEINKIEDVFTEATQLIETLGQQSNQISAIVNVIKEIADQTNLLALNAAIEAARAGEHGRGFAVVADEVRKLAERTTSSAQEIVHMISDIQAGAQQAVQGMSVGGKQVSDGVEMAAKAGDAMMQIETSSRKVIESVSSIVEALREQSNASIRITQNMDEIAGMAGVNSLSVKEITGSADNLVRLASELQQSAKRFRMP